MCWDRYIYTICTDLLLNKCGFIKVQILNPNSRLFRLLPQYLPIYFIQLTPLARKLRPMDKQTGTGVKYLIYCCNMSQRAS